MIKYRKLKNLLIWKCKQKKVGSQLPTATRMAELEEVEPPIPLVLLPCTTCNRTFRPEALPKHTKVCEKMLMKKRKKFDSAKQRLHGTDVPNFPPPPKQKESPLKPISQSSKWREKQVELTKSLNSMRKKSDGNLQVKPSDHEQCPYCERFFGPKAYDRHTEWCKEQHIKLKNNNNINNEARERLQVRTKYRAPLSNRVLTRDKYLPRSRDPSPMSLPKVEADETIKQKSPSPLNRTSSLRMSGRSKTMITKTPSFSPSESKDIKPRANLSSTTVRAKSEKEIKVSGKEQLIINSEHTKPKILSSSHNPKKDVAKYDPFASAELQMLELFGGPIVPSNVKDPAPEIVPSPDEEQEESVHQQVAESPSSSEPSPDHFPTSAFAIYTPNNNNDRPSSNDSVKSEGKENNNDSKSDGTLSPPPNEPIDNRKNFSLSNLSLCSIISIDSIDCNRNPIGLKSYPMRDEPLQRSCSAVEGKSSRNRVKVNMQQMLYGFDAPAQPLSPSRSSATVNLEACEAELIVSMMEFEKMLNNSPIPNYEQSPSPSSNDHLSEKTSNGHLEASDNTSPHNELQDSNRNVVPLSIDSAYGSLTRAAGDADTSPSEPSKFCHECGTKYPIPKAKFCCNCGIRRLAV